MRIKYLHLVVFSVMILTLSGGCTGADPKEPPSGSKIIEITQGGFSPQTLTINAGDTVAWINKDTVAHWPASANHPTHEVYPESGGCIGSKFDACHALANGESFAFTFKEKGEWKYHDHLNCCTNPAFFGTIIVK